MTIYVDVVVSASVINPISLTRPEPVMPVMLVIDAAADVALVPAAEADVAAELALVAAAVAYVLALVTAEAALVAEVAALLAEVAEAVA